MAMNSWLFICSVRSGYSDIFMMLFNSDI
jgi:hypothetical protein